VNGIGGRIKNPTNTIEFIFKHEVPTEQKRDVTYGGILCAQYDPKRLNYIKRASPFEETGSTTLAKLPPPLHTVTDRENWYPAFGDTTHSQHNSLWLLTTLE
jgi:hypothetical protein